MAPEDHAVPTVRKINFPAIRESINIAGSIASLTGISLVWLRGIAPTGDLAIAVPAFFIASLFAIGTITLAYTTFWWGFREFVSRASLPAKVMYCCFASGLLLMLLGVALTAIYIYARVMAFGRS